VQSPLSIFRRELSSISLGAAKPTTQRRHTKPKIEGAMKRKNRIEITVETRLTVIRRGTNLAQVWCNGCSSPVQWITPEEAAARGRQHAHRLPLGGSRSAHVVETETQALLICLNSLLTFTYKGEKTHVTQYLIDRHTYDE
jgi:hypothetical protein